MAQEEVVKISRLRGKVSMKGFYWENNSSETGDASGQNDLKVTITKKNRSDYLVKLERVSSVEPTYGFNMIGRLFYDEKIGPNEKFKSIDDLFKEYLKELNKVSNIKSNSPPTNPYSSFSNDISRLFGSDTKDFNGFIKTYLEKKSLVNDDADSGFFDIIQDTFTDELVPISTGYFSIWEEWDSNLKKWGDENQANALQRQTQPSDPPPTKPGEKSQENTIDPSKVYTFDVSKTGVLVNSDFGTFSLKGEGVVERDFDFTESEDELLEEFREADFKGQDETESEEALYPMSEERKADLDAESSSLQKNSSQKEQEIIKSGKHDLDLIPPPPGKSGYLDNDKNIINLCAIDGSLVNILIAPSFLDMREAAKRDGIILKVSSGFRAPYDMIDAKSSRGTVVKASSQQYLYDGYLQKKPGFNLAAKPGGSPHGYGIGMDLNTGGTSKARKSNVNRNIYQWLCENSWKYGFVRSVVNEEWHFDYRPEKAKNGPYGQIAGTDANKFYSDWGLDKMKAPDWKVPTDSRV